MSDDELKAIREEVMRELRVLVQTETMAIIRQNSADLDRVVAQLELLRRDLLVSRRAA